MHSRTERRALGGRRVGIAAAVAVAVVLSSLPATAAFADGGITPPSDLAIQGTMKVGSTISIPSAGWTPDTATLSVSWKADGTTITEPVDESSDLALDLGPDTAGKRISADVTATVDGADPAVEHVDATGLVAPGDFSAAPQPVITGTPAVGSPLEAQTGGWEPAADFTYAWKTGDEVVSTAATFTPAFEQIGQSLTVTVTGSASGYESASRTSEPVTVGEGSLATDTPVISGAVVVGSTVTAAPGTWTPGTSFSYAWTVDGMSVGGDSAQYTPIEADQGKSLAVVVSGSLAGYASAQVASGAVTVGDGAFTTKPAPAISGIVRVDNELTALPGTWSPGATFTYRWSVSNGDVFTEATFTPTADQRGRTLTLTVNASRPGYSTVSQTTKPVTIGYGLFTTKPVPSISGTVRVGNKLTAKPGSWAPSATFTYAWKVSGVQVSTASTFTPTAAQRGKGLVLTVKAARTGYTSVTQSTASKTIGYGVFSAPTPKISGSAIVGNTLTVSAGTWTPSATKTYRWLRNGISISGATGTSYKITGSDWGKKLSVRVTGTRTAYTTKSVTSASTASVIKHFSYTTAPTITGTKRVGATLTAHITSWSPTTTSHTWQWKRNGSKISGATAYNYKLTSADYGKKITVTYTGHHGGYVTTSRTSASTSTIQPSVGQEAALEDAQLYIEIFAMSKAELYDQLEYDGYYPSEAQFAVDHVQVSWYAEAAEAAETYMELFAMSADELYDQLIYDQFTSAQAYYGLAWVGY